MNKKDKEKNRNRQYMEYENIIGQLRDIGYFTEEEYISRLS